MWSRSTSCSISMPRLHPGEAVVERDPGAGDGGGAGAAVGLDDVAVDGDLPLAERLEIDHGAQAAADQALNFNGAAVLLAGRGLAPRALERGARQHAVFGGDPAARLALEPGRQAVLERRGDQHMGVAEFHEARAFRVFHHAALERDGAQFVGLSAARPHRVLPRCGAGLHEPMALYGRGGERQGPGRRGVPTCTCAADALDEASNGQFQQEFTFPRRPIGATQVSLAQLNERSREIFRQIVESYLATGEPVGSRNLSRIMPMTLSPASVRNVMSDLEQLGLVYAPHTSAGRLPTELGLRFFVDALMQVGDLDRERPQGDRGAGRRLPAPASRSSRC